MKARTWLCLLLCAASAACVEKPEAPTTGTQTAAADSTSTAGLTGYVPLSTDSNAMPVQFNRMRTFDFDLDGTAETVLLRASGPRWDSLTAHISIRSAAGAQMYADSFTTLYYIGNEPIPGATRADLDALIQRRLEETLDDRSFMTMTVGNMSDPAALQKRVSVEVWNELLRRPQFRYYAGGESAIGITWSSLLNQFVRTWDCC